MGDSAVGSSGMADSAMFSTEHGRVARATQTQTTEHGLEARATQTHGLEARATLHHLRQQHEKPAGQHNHCLADYIAPRESGRTDYMGGFVVTAA